MLNFDPVFEHWPLFVEGLGNTILISVITFLTGTLLAIPIALLRVAKTPVLNQLAWFWIYFFRGAPLLLVLYVIYYGFPQFDVIRNGPLWFILREAWWCAIIAMTCSGSAYMAEIMRLAIVNVPHGEKEAAIAAGMSPARVFFRVVAPRAFGLALPMIANEAVFKIHSSAIISTVTIFDIVGAGKYVNTRYFLPYEGYVAAAVIFLILVMLTTWTMSTVESRALRYLQPRT